jgi:hypothetical protein
MFETLLMPAHDLGMAANVTERSLMLFDSRRADRDTPVEVLVARKPTAKAQQICRDYARGKPVKAIAADLGVTPSRVYNILRKPNSQQLLDMQMESLYAASVDAIADVLVNGSDADRLRAARLQMEATGRIGPRSRHRQEPMSREESDAHLQLLASRLTALRAEVLGDGCTVGVPPDVSIE